MSDHDNGATIRLAATIARGRYDVDGGTMIADVHPETIVEMALAAKREVDRLRASNDSMLSSLDQIAAALDVAHGTGASAPLAAIARLRAELAEANLRTDVVGKELLSALAARDEARAELAEWKRATGYDDAERLDFVLGRSGIDTHISVLTRMRDDAQRERDEARRDLTEAIIRESESNRELGREQMRSEAARRERDARPAISRDDAAAWRRGKENASTWRDEDGQKRVIAALRAHAAGSGEETP